MMKPSSNQSLGVNEMNKFVWLALAVVVLTGCTSNEVRNVQSEPVPTTLSGKQISMANVEKAIQIGARKLGWKTRVVKPGLIEANLALRTHRATVEIPYAQGEYSILYKDSANLDHADGRIHRNYNRWVANLSHAIQSELTVVQE